MINDPNAPNLTMPETHSRCFCRSKRISWSAVIVGALVGVGLCFLLNLFCLAIGASIMRTTPEGVTAFAWGGFLALLVSTIIGMFVAGFSAGYLGRPVCLPRNLGALYGFTAWVIALLLTLLFATHTNQFITSFIDDVYHRPHTVITQAASDDNTPAISQTGSNDATVNAQKTVNDIGVGLLVIFVLFFAGALASSFGGHCAMSCCRKDEFNCCNHLDKKCK